ncbi:arf-GAP with Rho-GAP domain, ANK repeat and PH domain-containing protein 1-like isoform X3 [Mercenaria mercenaria]|uniref:arf-GAP with Rho-GAP domain, ANK repeat and PH domain-containing protein 1-like isoform X3 n=1 Tax=Mercenaria mercenaria TaxID=6596 RepID=UPI00234FA86F|nr:arf-GAP with Rho-GAP domain, ANK repeat and PH domain-containing protein 1-like isoform X3 [Mercenaria mercenaria]
MAEHHSLQYWLESINLPQYYLDFIQHGLITREQCASLDEQTLTNIGVTLPGHQRRILTHLPNDDNWIENETTVPNLPPKKKSVRDSYLFQDRKPPDSLNVQTNSGNIDKTTGLDSVKVSPRPVPRPRQKSSHLKSPATTPNEITPNEEKPKPTKRPTPAPRNLISPKTGNKQTVGSLPDKHENSSREETSYKPQENHLDFENVSLRLTADSQIGVKVEPSSDVDRVQNLHDSVKLDGACMEETSTDDASLSELYSFPDKKKTPEKSQSDTETADSTVTLRHGTNESDKHVKETNGLERAEAEDLYINIDDSGESILKNLPEKDKNREIAEASCSAVLDTTERYENAEFDPVSKTYQVKSEGVAHINSDNVTRHLISEPVSRNSPELCKSDNVEIEGDNEGIYEPIWEHEEKESVTKAAENHRASSLMQFSPLVTESNTCVITRPKEKPSAINTQVQNRMSTFENRDSASFDMPPPQFAPPPLPPAVISMKDVISDFDPLTEPVAQHMPPVPPRPTNYKPPKLFKPYENVQFPMGAESSTLPGHHSDIEPDLPVYSPASVSYQDARISSADDPFKYEDPFGQFKPDCEGFEPESFPPSSCNTQGPIAPSGTEGDAIYEAAEDPDAFDPFGLNQKPSLTSLPRSISSGSSGSQYRLSEVPPAPKWYQATPDTGRMYSVAGNLNDVDSSSNGSLDDLIDSGDTTEEDTSSGTMTQVEILPTTALSPRRKERSGYLYKQGGVKQNRGWRKRWVIFDSKTLRYYSNSRDQVSKRIVPLSCMTNVEMDVKLKDMLTAVERMSSNDRPLSRIMLSSSEFFERKKWRNSQVFTSQVTPNNSRQFKFKLHCTNRVFLFATDNLDDCKMWSNTLMEAIITYDKPKGGEVPGGDMANPDIDAWIKINKNRYKFYVVLKGHKLCYYQNDDDFKMASPLHEIDMKLSSVKEVDRTKLQLNTHYSTFLLHFESSSDASNWKMAIEEAITDALGDNSILDQVKENPDNGKCADCGATDAHWASMNLGIVLCVRCAGIHRGFDPRLSKIRSLRMDTRVWNSSLIEMFKEIGNDNANNFWLKNMPTSCSISVETDSEARKQHIHHKYKDKLYCDKHPLAENKEMLNEALLQVAQTDNVLVTYQILMSGADILYNLPGHPNSTAFEMAKEAHQRIQMEYLLQNGGDKTKNFMPGSEEASLVAKLRAEVQWQGYLQKTGSNMKVRLHGDDFLKRWCVLEHGHLSYYVSEESKVEKDRIDNESILCIQAVHNDKHAACFEISSKKNSRVYLFAAASEEERLHWIRSISRVFCPVDLMDQIKQMNFSLAGYAHIKNGINRDWQRSWFMLENRKLIFIDKEETEREQDSLDLRKVSSITKIIQTQTACEACLESSGPQFVLKSGEIMLYFQADLIKDTDRIFSALESSIKKGGDILEEQALTNDDVPIIISCCIDFIEQYGLRMDGLYRKADTESKIKALLLKFQEDARSVVLRIEEESVHLVCNVLKRFLRNLSDPLLTAHLYKRWIQTAAEIDHNVKLQWYKYLLQQLPRINYLTLRTLASHLSKLSKHADENLMNLHNISIAFGSTLMKSDKVEDVTINASAVGSSMQLEMKVISDVVTYHEWLFDIKDDERKSSLVEDKIREAQRKMEEINKNRTTVIQSNDMMIFVYYLDPKGNAESVRINKDTTAADIVHTLTTKLKLTTGSWTVHEIIKNELERPLDPNVKVWPLVYEWQNWSSDYSAAATLCLKSSEFREKLERAYDPSKPLFAEMKYCEKKRFVKMAFEFTQARLSCYKDTKNVSNPAGSWNIEDLSIYRGCDSKKSPPTKFSFTFLSRGDKVGEKDLPCFGRAVCCTSEHDMLSWMSGLQMAQHPRR